MATNTLWVRSSVVCGMVLVLGLCGLGAVVLAGDEDSDGGGDATLVRNGFKACVASIPEVASQGQRFLAVSTCQRDARNLSRLSFVIVAGGAESDRGGNGTFIGNGFKACIAKIPKSATPGQQLLAEDTCQRDAQASGITVDNG